MKQIPITGGAVVLCDDEDYAKLIRFRWRRTYFKNKHTQYAMAYVRNEGKYSGCVYMHRLLTDAGKGQQVDHIDGNGLNNQKANLRLCSQSQNNVNGRKRAGSSSQHKGVTWRKDTGKWQAQAWANGKRYSLGCYQSEERAALAYNRFMVDQFGEFVRQNDVPDDLPPEPPALKYRGNYTSQYRGVCLVHGKWHAQAHEQGRVIHLGFYDSEVLAAQAYNEHERMYRHDKAILNSL